MRRYRSVLGAAGPVLALIGWLLISCGPPAEPLVLATTTSVGNSGLLEAILPAFERERGLTVRAHLVGSGLALKMLADRNADVVISHAPDTEAQSLREHPGWQYRKIMFNDFILVGPPGDPAHLAGSTDVRDAMRRIARSSSTFVSRGDHSGTHEREERLWTLAAARPSGNRLVAAGAGMGSTLRVASETGAYTLTDRATYAQHASAIRLEIVFEGGPDLLNTYAVVVDPSGPRARDARAFAEWLATGEGRRLIQTYEINHQPVFTVWPEHRPANSPSDTPQ